MGFFIKTGIICKTTFIRNNSYLKFVCLSVFFAITLNIANVKISQNVVLGMQFEVCSLKFAVYIWTWGLLFCTTWFLILYAYAHALCLNLLLVLTEIFSGHLGFIRQQESRQIFVVWFSGCCSKSLQVLTVTNLSIKFTLFTTWFLFDGLLHDKTLSSLERLLLIIHNHPKN